MNGWSVVGIFLPEKLKVLLKVLNKFLFCGLWIQHSPYRRVFKVKLNRRPFYSLLYQEVPIYQRFDHVSSCQLIVHDDFSELKRTQMDFSILSFHYNLQNMNG